MSWDNIGWQNVVNPLNDNKYFKQYSFPGEAERRREVVQRPAHGGLTCRFSFPPHNYFFSFPPSQLFLSFSPLLFQACPAQRLWTTNGADPRGTARLATSTGDTDYLWIVGQCGDSAGPPQNVSVVCKTELFAKTECPRAHKVPPQLAAWAWNEMWGKNRSQAPVTRNLDTLAK